MRRLFALIVVLGFAAALPLRAEEPLDKKEAKTDKPRKLRLVKPWSDLSTLSDEQKARISEIHAEFVEKMNDLRDEEETAILAVLTEENKTELAEDMAAKKQADKERNAARRAAARAAATRPAND